MAGRRKRKIAGTIPLEKRQHLRFFSFILESTDDGTYLTARDKNGEVARLRLPTREFLREDMITFTFNRRNGVLHSVILEDSEDD